MIAQGMQSRTAEECKLFYEKHGRHCHLQYALRTHRIRQVRFCLSYTGVILTVCVCYPQARVTIIQSLKFGNQAVMNQIVLDFGCVICDLNLFLTRAQSCVVVYEDLL